MQTLLDSLTTATQGWSDLYGASVTLETAVMFLHLGGMLAAGGIAFTLDRAVVRAGRGWPRRADLAKELHTSHGAVLVGLGIVVVSGLALTLADPAYFLTSWVFWAKMVAVALLLVNGWVLKVRGDGLLTDPDDDRAFARLRTAAVRSAALWAVSLLGGIAITMYI